MRLPLAWGQSSFGSVPDVMDDLQHQPLAGRTTEGGLCIDQGGGGLEDILESFVRNTHYNVFLTEGEGGR